MSAKSPDKVDIEVGQRIKMCRTAAGLSQTVLAEELGVTFQQVQKYEQGRNRVGAGRLAKIAEVLNVPVTKLLGVDEENAATKKRHEETRAPLQLLTVEGAQRLLRAYGKIQDRIMRRSIVGMIQNIVHRAAAPPKKR